MKLNTLEDIEKEVSFITITYGNQQITPVKMKHPFSLELKKEAIKWITQYLLSLDEETNPTSKTSIYMDKETMYWIKHFFNITEEDLK